MEGPLVDIVLLGLLVIFFGIQQRSRPQLYFRLWFAGWIFVFVSFLLWEFRISSPQLASFRELLRIDSLFLGGMAFLLSLIVRERQLFKAFLTSLSVAVPACILSRLVADQTTSFVSLFILVLLLQGAFIHLVFTLVPIEWRHRRITLGIVSVLIGVTMIVLARSGRSATLDDWINAQVFLSAGVLFSGSGERRSLDRFIGTFGFFSWGLAYPLSSMLHGNPGLLHLLFQLWNLPKYGVGFAMTLRIFDGARNDIVRLADSYKNLYGDFRMLYEHHPLPMWIYDAETSQFLSTNAAATESYGYTQDEFLRMTIDQIGVAPEPPAAANSRGEPDPLPAVEGPASGVSEDVRKSRHACKDGSVIAVELTEHSILFQGRDARFVLAVDVTEREKLNQELFHRAQHDPLTGLPNRLLLDDRIAQCLARSSREHKKAVMFTMDADRFKLINDTYGHLVGDECLKAISDRLRGRIRSVDTVARTGGEEFTAIIGGLNNAEDAEKIATMFLRLFDNPLNLPGQDLKVSISIGGAIYPDDGIDADTLRKKSDQALYHAKRFGRNRYAMASREVCASFDQAMEIELAVREALRADGFELVFQPIYDNEGCASHFESLLRMKPSNPVIFSPSLFIPVAEECGLIVPLGNWVVEQACRQLREWRSLGGDAVTIGINVSGKQLLQKGFGPFVLECLRAHELPPSALQIELNEGSLMTEPVIMREAMSDLAAKGIRFAIDDFGTGYSSLARLADLPIALLKIDRTFIAQLDPAKRTDGIVTAIIHMAQTLNVQVVAEGVESEAQLNVLLRRGCDMFQGFYLSPPIPPGEVSVFLEHKNPLLFAHPNFSQTRVAVSKRVRRAQVTALATPSEIAS